MLRRNVYDRNVMLIFLAFSRRMTSLPGYGQRVPVQGILLRCSITSVTSYLGQAVVNCVV